MGGGGGVSGEVKFPPYIESWHTSMLGTWSGATLGAVINSTATLAPYNTSTLTSPAADITAVADRYDLFDAVVHGLAYDTDWQAIAETVKTKLDTAGVLKEVDVDAVITAARNGARNSVVEAIQAAVAAADASVIEELAESFSTKLETQKARALRGLGATMSSINAINSSAFLFASAMIESEHLQRVAEFKHTARLEAFRAGLQTWTQSYAQELSGRLEAEIREAQTRNITFADSLRLVASMRGADVQAQHAAVDTLKQIKALDIAATHEHETAVLDKNVKDSLWDLEVYYRGANILSAPAGMGSPLPEKASRAQSAMAGAMGGASIGANFGAQGALIGAGIGALAGAITG